MEEKWLDVIDESIPDVGLFYQVSNFGRIKSKRTNKIKATSYNNYGYENIMFSINGKNYGRFVHKIVAKAFIPNPNNYSIINHIDQNPKNNIVNNLEWCSILYNNTYKNAHLKRGEKFSKEVWVYDLSGEFINKFASGRAFLKYLGHGSSGSLSEACNKNHIYLNFIVSFEELFIENIQEILNRSFKGRKTNLSQINSSVVY